jgi:ABC-2 type transport system permease protein
MLKGITRIFLYEFKRQARRPGYIFTSFGIPIIALTIFFGIMFIQQSRQNNPPEPEKTPEKNPFQSRAVGFIDYSGLIEEPKDARLIKFENEEAARAALKTNEIGFYYVVPANYLEVGDIDMYFDRITLTGLDNVALQQLVIESLIEKSDNNIDANLIRRLQTKPEITTHTLNSTGNVRQAAGEGESFVLVYIFALLLMMTAFTTSGYLMQSVLEEKESRMVEVILSSVKPRNLLAGKILALGTLGLVQMATWVLTTIYIMRSLASSAIPGIDNLIAFNISNGQLAIIVLYFILGYLLFGSAYAAIGAISTSMREGPQLAAFITLPAAVPLWATSLFATAPNGSAAVILSIIPVTSPLAMVMRASITDVPFEQVALSAVLLLATVLFMMWFAARLFRVNTLLSGQMPKFRDLLRLVRENA